MLYKLFNKKCNINLYNKNLKRDYILRNFIINVVSQNNFVENDIWKGKKIKKEIENENFFESKENCKDVFKIVSLQQLNESMNDIKLKSLKTNFNGKRLYEYLLFSKDYNEFSEIKELINSFVINK